MGAILYVLYFLFFCIFILVGHCYTSLALVQALWADATRTEHAIGIPEAYTGWRDDVFFCIPYFVPNNS